MSNRPGDTLPRGYFAIGAERICKALNLGDLMRSAHGFGAAFTFTIGASYQALEARADTSKGRQHLPHYSWASAAELTLPEGCRLVGVELLDEAVDLPSFRHPLRAAYVLGPEQGTPIAGASRPLRPRGAHPHQLLRQPGDGRRHRHVRPRALPRALPAASDRRRRPAGRDRADASPQDRQITAQLTGDMSLEAWPRTSHERAAGRRARSVVARST